MRIIAGERRGHKIDGPKGTSATRPTSDFVRESLFNILREVVIGRVVVDLFAGTGALGLEAVSRGAARAIFVEQSRENVALIYKNMSHLRYEDRARIQATDAYRWVKSFVPVDAEPMVVMLDPPYREYEIHHKKLNQLLATLVKTLPAGSTVVVESGRTLDERILPDLDAWDVRRYGGTQVAIRDVNGSVADVEPDRSHDDDDADSDADA